MTTKITGANIDSIANTGVKWNAVTVADGSTILNASAGNGYFLDTNAGVIEVNLPSSPSRGDTVILADYAGNFATNNVRVRSGSNLIDSVEQLGSGIGYVLSTNDLIVELVYVDSTKGWMSKENESKSDLTAAADTNTRYVAATGGTVVTTGNFKVHVFTGDGCFVVSTTPVGAAPGVDYLVVAGGGSGGDNSSSDPGDSAGGGGAGGMRYSKSTLCTAHPIANPTGLTLPAATYPVSVGGGGAAQDTPGSQGNAGSNSVFSTITSTGGGGGGAGSHAGGNGGSGGGMSGGGQGSSAGNGNTPPVSPPQGNNGGRGGATANGGSAFSPDRAGGGGGGAGAVGGDVTAGGNSGQGVGGAGAYVPNTFFGPTAPSYGQSPAPLAPNGRYFAGGGGGTSPQGQGSPFGAGGGAGGGGSYCNPSPDGLSTPGIANTGGGGGGAAANGTGFAGGKGVVILRYQFQAD